MQDWSMWVRIQNEEHKIRVCSHSIYYSSCGPICNNTVSPPVKIQFLIYQDVVCDYRKRPRYQAEWQNKDDVWCHAMGLGVNLFMRTLYMSVISVSYSICFPYLCLLLWPHFLQIPSSEEPVFIQIRIGVSCAVIKLWHIWDNIIIFLHWDIAE